MLHLASRVWDSFKAVYIDTGIAFPEVLPFVQQVCSDWGIPLIILRPKVDFFEYARRYGFPTIKRLWCRKYLKILPLREYVGKRVILGALGIRRMESRRRTQKYKHYFSKSKETKIHQIYPILEWTDKQRDEYLKKYNIPINPCYKNCSTKL